MSVRVVSRIRPLLGQELDKDIIVTTCCDNPNVVRIPNPKNPGESYSFQFNGVYESHITQEEFFQKEVAPTVKHLFQGIDVTLFAYGVTGTGKTYGPQRTIDYGAWESANLFDSHTMRGGKSMAQRGVIPRLLSGIYRRSRKIEKDSEGYTTVEVAMSYYEIYNDRVFDLFEPPEKRIPSGLPIRDNHGKTVVVGLTERPCTTLKEFETLYDQANVNRSTSATKLNAHSSRSHAVLCVKVTVTKDGESRMSTASAIDLAGSEDNRRTDNGKERLVESASINKSLFVLAQCVEAITTGQKRIPYRESKMTRILSLGQNNGLTIMILNLAPVKSYHLDTLSSLNFSNRTKKIEVREVENEPFFKGPARAVAAPIGRDAKRAPLRPLTSTSILNLTAPAPPTTNAKRPKLFSVYSSPKANESLKRNSAGLGIPTTSRPSKLIRPADVPRRLKADELSSKTLEEIVEKKVEQILAARAFSESQKLAPPAPTNEDVRERLTKLEQKVEKNEDARAEGLEYMRLAREATANSDLASALQHFEAAVPFFPTNTKLQRRIAKLQAQLDTQGTEADSDAGPPIPRLSSKKSTTAPRKKRVPLRKRTSDAGGDSEYHAPALSDYEPEDSDGRPKARSRTAKPFNFSDADVDEGTPQTPRTARLLAIINSRDAQQIVGLKGVGGKKADAILEGLRVLDGGEGVAVMQSLKQVAGVRGIGGKSVEKWRLALD
ncbi:MAG: hypothetical protein M1829_004797 [Trizodia sp. TS-e1964]|nr:MAG: hypothetical protein M1829_004797 [Trizodia sp. TS-e1964]